MSKRLPYFQFEPAEYLAGDIFFCSYGAQGMFNNICALYWQKDCELKYSQVVKRLKNEELIQELISENIIKVENDKITINFLNEQFSKATIKHVVNSENGKKGATKRWQKNSEAIAKPLKSDSESIALRKDKIKEDKVINTNLTVDWEKLKDNFNSLTGKGTKIISNKVKGQINARLKEGYTKNDLWNAIVNCFNDPYHKENPRFLTLEFISRPDKIEKYSVDIITKPKKQEDRL